MSVWVFSSSPEHVEIIWFENVHSLFSFSNYFSSCSLLCGQIQLSKLGQLLEAWIIPGDLCKSVQLLSFHMCVTEQLLRESFLQQHLAYLIHKDAKKKFAKMCATPVHLNTVLIRCYSSLLSLLVLSFLLL